MILDSNLSTEAIDSFPSIQPVISEQPAEEKTHDLFAPPITNQEDYEKAMDYGSSLPEGRDRDAYKSAIGQYKSSSKAMGIDPWAILQNKLLNEENDKATYSALDLNDPAIEAEAREVIGEEEVAYLKQLPESLRKDFAVGRATKIMFGDDSYDSRAMLGEKLGISNGDTDGIFNKLRESGDKRRELTLKIKGERKQVREMAFSNLESDGEVNIDYLQSKGLGSAEAIAYWRELKPSFDKARNFMLAWGDEARQTKYVGAWEQDKVIASLTALREENQEAYDLIMDGTMAVMKGEQKDNLPFLSAFAGGLLKAGRGMRGAVEKMDKPAVSAQTMYSPEIIDAYSYAKHPTKLYSQEENITLRDLRSVCDLSWEPPEDAGRIRKLVDGTGSMMGQTAAFMATSGWSSIANAEEAFVDSRAEGNNVYKSLVYGGIKGSIQYGTEKMGLGSFAKVRKFGIGTPFGKVNHAVESWANKGGLASQFMKKTGVNAVAEMGEEWAAPVVEYGLGNPLSYALGAGQQITLNEAMNDFGHAIDLNTGIETVAMSAIFGGVTTGFAANDRRAFMREMSPERRGAVLKICESPAILEQMGAKPREIKKLMSTANPDKQIMKFYDLDLPARQQEQAAVQNGDSLDAIGREGFSKQEGNEVVQKTLGDVDDVVVIPAEFAMPQELMAAGEIDTFKRLDDGNWEVTNRKSDEKTILDEDQAKNLLNAQLTQARGEDAIRDALIKESEVATVNLVEHFQNKDAAIQFEKLNEPQTMMRLEAQAKLAGDKIAKLNLEGRPNAEAVVDTDIDGQLTLGAVRDMPGKFAERIKEENEMNGTTSLSSETAATNAYNLTKEDGTAIIRWVEKGATPLNIIEEGNEIFIKRDIANRGSNEWHVDNLRVFQATEEYGKLGMGELVPEDGAVDDSRVVEAMSRVMRAVLTNKINETKLPEQTKRFIAWVRRVLSSIMSLAKLGSAYESAAKAGKIDANWQNWVYESAGITGETWRQEREKAGNELVSEANAAANFSISQGTNKESLQDDENKTEYRRNGAFISREVRQDLSGEERGDTQQGDRNGGTDTGLRTEIQQGEPAGSSRQSGENVRGAGGLLSSGRSLRNLAKREHSLSPEAKEKAASLGFYVREIYELASGKDSAEAFRQAILEAKQSRGVFGDCVYAYEAEEYADMRLFLTPDGMAGIALKPDGDMVSVFSHADQKNSVEGKTAHSLIALAISEGATKADCYGWFLAQLYGKLGFREVAKDSFNPDYATESMQNKEAMLQNFPDEEGKPDVVYLVYEGNRDNVLDEFNSEYLPSYQSDLEYTDYDACVEIQSNAVEDRSQKFESSFSLGSDDITQESEMAEWGNQLLEYLDGKNPNKRRDMRVCTTPAVLRMLGAKPHDLVMTPGVVDKVMEGKHAVSLEAMKQLPKAISEPIAVFDSTTSSNSLVILTELKEGENNIVVAVHLDSPETGGHVVVNRVMSLYGKDNKKALLSQPMRYLDIKKARPWLATDRLQLPVGSGAKNGANGKLLNPDDLVKWKEKNGINFSTQGDEIKAQTQRFIASGQAAQARFWEATSKRVGKEIDRVDKLLSGEITSREEYLLAVNRAIGVVQTAAAMLPPGYRFPIEHYVTRLGLLAEMASTGEINVSRRLNESARREYLRESVKDLGDQIESLREEARADLENAQSETLASKQGELDEKIEAKYRALDYQERAVAKDIYNKRNKEIISIRKRFKSPDVISGKISRANARLDDALSKLETRQEKLEKAISKLEERRASLKAKGIKERDIFSASEADITEIRKAWAEGKANELIKTFLERINSKVDEFTKDSYKKAMSKIIASVMPKKTKTGAPQKSRALDADATRTVLSIAESMGLKADTLDGRLAAIEQESEAVSNDATLTNEARRIKLAELEANEIRLKTFGCVEGMDSTDMAIALNELVKFVGSGRESWANKIEDRLARLDEIADRIMKELPEASDADLQKARSARSEDENGKMERGEKSPIGKFFTGLYNFPNFLKSLSSLKPLKEAYQQRMVDEQNRITDRTLAMQRRMNSAIVDITGGKKIREVTAWLGNNKIVKDTGITYITRSMKKGQLTVEDAKRLIDSDFKGSDKTVNERAAIREGWKDYEAKGMRSNRKYISYTFEESQKTEKLFASKFQVLNMLLWADQDSYKINAFEQGYTDDVLKEMKDYVGKDVIAFGEYLKEECRLLGKDAAKVFEALLGIPFPMHDKYFPGRHLKLDKMSDRDALQTLSGGYAIGKGGAAAFTKTRRNHHEKVDQSVDAACSFLQHAAAVIQWTETQETVSELKYILKRRDIAQRIIASIGKDRYDTLLKWIDKHELGGVEQAKSIESSDAMARACYEPLVYGLLLGNVGTIIRQAEGIMNAPASMNVGCGEWMRSAGRTISWQSAQTINELWKNPTFQRRMNGMCDGKFGAYMTTLAAGTKSGTTFAQFMQYVNAGMIPMEYADAASNVVTYAIGYDAVFRAEKKSLEKINKERETADRLSDEQIDKLAHESAQSALDLAVAEGAQGMDNLTKPFDMGNHGFGRLFVMFSSDAVKSSMQTAALWKSGRKGKAVAQWILRGLVNQAIAYGIDWLNNDEDPPEWEDYIAGIALGAWNGIALLGGLGEAINMLTAELGWTNKAKFGGAGRLIFDPVGAAKSIGKVVKMATDEKDDSWIDYTKGSLNAVKSGAIAGGTVLKATAKGGKMAEQAFAGLMAAAGASNVAKFGVNVADKLDLQDNAKDMKETQAEARREAKKARED